MDWSSAHALGDMKDPELDRNVEMIKELLSILEAHPVKVQEADEPQSLASERRE